MDMEEPNSEFLIKSISARPDTINKLVHRVRALTLQLLPVQVSLQSLKDPTSSIITPRVVSAYVASAGDFVEALPYALLRARRTFLRDASHNIADWEENMGRSVACEVLARRIVHSIGPDRLTSVMSTRYRYRETNGEISNPSSALELAVDENCSIFLSSNESQLVINSLWDGRLVQRYDENDAIEYVPFKEITDRGFLGHFDPSRFSVPRYQNIFHIAIWGFFLLTYSQAVRQPLEKLDPRHQSLDVWEYILYILALSFMLEELRKWYNAARLVRWHPGIISFWTVVSAITLALLITAFAFRIIGIVTDDANGVQHLRSFQVLSCIAPLIWMRLITVFDGFKYIGTMQICVGRMLQESTIFFALLALLFAGFLQAMVALDESDGIPERGTVIIHTLMQALLQSPDFDNSGTNTFGMVLYYFWTFANAVILLNILISLFASAYQDVVGDAEAQYLAFFAGKTIAMIRAPDHYVYPPPFNLIEYVFVIPWEFLLSKRSYAKLNGYIMLVIFCVPLAVLTVCETLMDTNNVYIRDWFWPSELGNEDSPEARDPQVDDEDGRKIAKVKFDDLIKGFPNTTLSSSEIILREILALRRKIDELADKLADAKTV